MAEYIRRDIVLDIINTMNDTGGFAGYADYSTLFDKIDTMPAADVKRVKRGKWDFIGHQLFKCTNCTKIYTQKQLEDMGENWAFPDFCPKCGADMRG